MGRKSIFIRTDGNEVIATGHVMRCLAIAEKLRLRGVEVIFVMAGTEMNSVISSHGFRTIILATDWNNPDGEIEKFQSLIIRNQIKVVLLDSYFITEYYLREISRYTKIVYIDDLHNVKYPVHAIISYSVRNQNAMYGSGFETTQILMGGRYVPLREEFENVIPQTRKDVNNILVTMGGSDPANATCRIVASLIKNSKYRDIQIHVVAGRLYHNLPELLQISEADNVCVHHNVLDMKSLMLSCDIAIAACGTTLYELCACGIPTICVEISENQVGSEIWEEKNQMFYAGNFVMDPEGCVQVILECLDEYIASYALRKERAETMHQVVDGAGADRIAEYLENEVGEEENE